MLISSAPPTAAPVFSVPVRWTLRVLAWIAFFASAYLAWHAVNQTSVAGCGVGSVNGCDAVMASRWSKWLGVPVALPGLACYAGLAALSVLLGLRNAAAARWINTAFVLLALLAAGASLWFLAVQVFAIGHFCMFCILTDVCGVAIGAITMASVAMWLRDTQHLRRARSPQAGLMTLRSALPAPGGVRPPATLPPAGASPGAPPQRDWPAPSMPIALGGAAAVLIALIGGQLVFPGKTFEVEQVALQETINLESREDEASKSQEPNAERAEPSAAAPPQVVMRVPMDDPDPRSAEQAAGSNAEAEGTTAKEDTGSDESEQPTEAAADETAASTQPTIEPTSPPNERLVSFLGGKLTLDMYKHPVIGSREAPHVLVEMVSYDCAHCRKTHRHMKRALSRYGSDQVAVIVMVIPLERSCNKLITNPAASNPGACATARMALGIAALKPAAFARFHDWLMNDPEKLPPRDQIVARAYKQVDGSRLRELSSGQQLKKQIEQYVDLFGALSRQRGKEFGLPVQILGDHVLSGVIEKPEELYKAWEEHLGVEPR